MAITIKKNGDAGAPNLTGQVGSLITLLDWLLVTTMGWTKVYTGTNLAVYRAPTGNRRYLRINDTGAQDSLLRAYEAMTAISTGTGAFPTTAQVALASGLYFNKSSSADATAREWYFISNGTFFHLFSYPFGEATNPTPSHFCFGDFPSVVSGDAYNTLLMGNEYGGSYIGNGLALSTIGAYSTVYLTHAIPRVAAGTGTAQQCGKVSDNAFVVNSTSANTVTYPAQGVGGFIMGRLWLSESASGVAKGHRGLIPGVWGHAHDAGVFNNKDTLAGTGVLAGKSFIFLGVGGYGSLLVETSDTWDTI